jgi:hypothetical protein
MVFMANICDSLQVITVLSNPKSCALHSRINFSRHKTSFPHLILAKPGALCSGFALAGPKCQWQSAQGTSAVGMRLVAWRPVLAALNARSQILEMEGIGAAKQLNLQIFPLGFPLQT